MKQSNLNSLLKESYEAYYWIGFLLADGNFRNNRIRLTLAHKDKNHLEKYGKFVNCPNIGLQMTKYGCVSWCIGTMDSVLVPQIVKKFDISNRKTYNPPNLNIDNQDLLFSLLIGFIDGDGCIDYQFKRPHPRLRIKNHSSWINFLKLYLNFTESCKIKINNQGYATLDITKVSDLVNLKKKCIKLNLPILERKWNKIDMNFKYRRKLSEVRQ